jgi:hypothetical protein
MTEDTAAFLLTPGAVRARAQAMLAVGEAGDLEHFSVDGSKLPGVVARVLATTRGRYPDLAAIPLHSRWRHFTVGGIDRVATLALGGDRQEALRARFDLVVTSVLLDAGSGPRWRFREPGTGLVFSRSEGLAVASFHMFRSGGFASAPGALRADAAGLAAVTEETLARFFQVGPENPLVGLAGRVALLQRLAQAAPGGRVGGLADRLLAHAVGGALPAEEILTAVLQTFGPIWPGRHVLEGINLGDTWPHPRLGWVPLHKLSQWLTYSLVEPLESAGLRVTGLDALTGLAEYRNGGLFIDGGVLAPRADPGAVHLVGSPLVVEWRALTVALLDRVAAAVRAAAGADLPLVKVLEGGTWWAGREIAGELRADGGPPLRVDSDGTVF